jgi:hypothetical protein
LIVLGATPIGFCAAMLLKKIDRCFHLRINEGERAVREAIAVAFA